MFQSSTNVVVKVSRSIINVLDIFDINVNSLKSLSLAGNEKADLFLEAAKYDVAAQRIELKQKLKEAAAT